MERPRITLSIFSSLDGKITGSFAKTAEIKKDEEVFEAVNFTDQSDRAFHFQGWIYGSGTGEEFTNKQEPELLPLITPLPAGDFITNLDQDKYFIAFDRIGKLGWKSQTTSYAGQEAYVIEILTEEVSEEYKSFLRRKNISYLIAGKEQIDIPLALSKLHNHFHLTNLMLGGGGILNWSFLDEGLCDEINLFVAPAIDGQDDATPLFSSRFNGNPHPIAFDFKSVEVLEGGTLWLRYTPSEKTNRSDCIEEK